MKTSLKERRKLFCSIDKSYVSLIFPLKDEKVKYEEENIENEKQRVENNKEENVKDEKEENVENVENIVEKEEA